MVIEMFSPANSSKEWIDPSRSNDSDHTFMVNHPLPGSDDVPFDMWSRVPDRVMCSEHLSMSRSAFWKFAMLAAQMKAQCLLADVYGCKPEWPMGVILLSDGVKYKYVFDEPRRHQIDEYPKDAHGTEYFISNGRLEYL